MTAIPYPMAIYSPEGAMSIVEDEAARAAVEGTWTRPVAKPVEATEDDGPDEPDAQGVVVKRGPGRPRLNP